MPGPFLHDKVHCVQAVPSRKRFVLVEDGSPNAFDNCGKRRHLPHNRWFICCNNSPIGILNRNSGHREARHVIFVSDDATRQEMLCVSWRFGEWNSDPES